jgi:hypothetical protein
MDMDTAFFINLSAILMGPILAVQAQKIVEKLKEEKKLKNTIFNTLMATRNDRLGYRHVEALNSIVLAYRDTKNEKKVINAWVEYHSVLHDQEMVENKYDQWLTKKEAAFIKLLDEMSKRLGYDYNLVEIEKGGYAPQLYAEQDKIQNQINAGLVDVLCNKKPLFICSIDKQITP